MLKGINLRELRLKFKRLLLAFVAFAFTFSCKKPAVDPPLSPGPVYDTYTVYKQADTVFVNSMRDSGILFVLVETLSGDTVYKDYNTTHASVLINPISNYDPGVIGDTLKFLTPISGTETSKYYKGTFKCYLPSGLFDDDAGSDIVYQLNRIDDKTLRLTEYEVDGVYTSDVIVRFFRKHD